MLGLSVTGYVIDTKFIIELFCFVFFFFLNQFSKIVKNKKIQNIKKKKKKVKYFHSSVHLHTFTPAGMHTNVTIFLQT